MFRLYKEGQALFIELLDAQNQLVTAKLQLNISLFDTWIKATEIYYFIEHCSLIKKKNYSLSMNFKNSL